MMDDNQHQIVLLISFRGKKVEIQLSASTSPFDVKSHLSRVVGDDLRIRPQDIKLIHKGKVITGLDESGELFDFFTNGLKKQNATSANGKKTVIRIMATAFSPTEAKEVEMSKNNAPRVRDDLSKEGRREMEERQRLGRKMLASAAKKGNTAGGGLGQKYGFGQIETLPMLPDQQKAKEILNSLANDPGVLACMAKHKWNVGCLAELYPEGEVGKSDVCVMGLNQNNGAKILLRLRTDDLTGFRKILSIKKVLYHELAHNVHSEHNDEFFKLMRQIEKECTEMDWTEGSGLSNLSVDNLGATYQGGTFRLGGQLDNVTQTMSVRELAAKAALTRMTKEEQEIQDACGCGRIVHNKTPDLPTTSQSKTMYDDVKDDEVMDNDDQE